MASTLQRSESRRLARAHAAKVISNMKGRTEWDSPLGTAALITTDGRQGANGN